jgi:hypothetical protein
MGLTVHFGIRKRPCSSEKARESVEKMHAIAERLPFNHVSDVRTLGPDFFTLDRKEISELDSYLQTCCETSVRMPWNKRASRRISPLEAHVFTIDPGEGSEWCSIGLIRYPETITAEYHPDNDARFEKTVKNNGWTSREFSPEKYSRWLRKNGLGYRFPYQAEQRTVPTKCGKGWSHGDFCKTQYASDPECGGAANFLLCHIGLISLLENIGRLPGVRVNIEDEGHYGPSTHSDDWREAYANKVEPTYVWHEATHDVQVLLKNLGDYNTMVATMVNGLNGEVESPIRQFENYADLVKKGQSVDDLQPFLTAMKRIREVSIGDR